MENNTPRKIYSRETNSLKCTHTGLDTHSSLITDSNTTYQLTRLKNTITPSENLSLYTVHNLGSWVDLSKMSFREGDAICLELYVIG